MNETDKHIILILTFGSSILFMLTTEYGFFINILVTMFYFMLIYTLDKLACKILSLKEVEKNETRTFEK